MVHAVVSAVLSGYCIVTEGYNRDAENHTKFQYVVLCHSLGYFSYDTVMEIVLDVIDSYIAIHHITSCCTIMFIIMSPYGGSTSILGLFLSEISTPMFLLKAALDRIGEPRNSMRYQTLLWVYSFIFGLSRAVLLQFVVYDAIKSTVIPVQMKIIFMFNIFVYHILLTSLIRLVWKSIPNWYEKPSRIENKSWWINGKNWMNKYTREAPWKNMYYTILLVHTVGIPSIYNFYLHFQTVSEPIYAVAQ